MEISQQQIDDDDTSLCCCEYISKGGEHYHILNLFCNLENLESFSFPKANQHAEVLLRIQKKMQFRWKGETIQISLEKYAPIFIIPIFIGLAALHLYMAIVMLAILLLFLYYTYTFLRPVLLYSKFYVLWTFWSVIYLFLFFELNMPMMKILPEENYLLLTLVCITLGFLWKVKKCSIQNYKSGCVMAPNSFNPKQPSGAFLHIFRAHCYNHSYWLDCCIDEFNCVYYLAGLYFATLTLLLVVYLIITAICVPRLIVRYKRIPIMMPNDCSAIFDEYNSRILFSIGVYALMMALYTCTSFMYRGFQYGKRKIIKE